ncbi:hypothetical protein [Nocardia xishanensis]
MQSAFVSGMSAMLWVCAGICLLATVLAAIFTRNRVPDPAGANGVGEARGTGIETWR